MSERLPMAQVKVTEWSELLSGLAERVEDFPASKLQRVPPVLPASTFSSSALHW